MFLPSDVKFIIDKFKENSYEAFIVGGCVRDTLLSKDLNDYDITTNAMPEVTQSLFDRTIPTGIKHGTITVMLNKEPYEITTYRIDGEYKDNRRPDDVIFVSDIKKDLSRRDFTINAMAYSPYFGFKDFFDGQKDLENKTIKAVGDANKRFNEDALRMLRAIRFASLLNFTIEEKTYKAIKDNAHLIQNVSYERINVELLKILKNDNATMGIKLLEETNLLENIYSEFHSKYFNKDYFLGNILYLDKINKFIPSKLCFMLQTCFTDISLADLRKALRKLKCDNKTIDSSISIYSNSKISSYININSNKELKIFLSSLDRNIITELFEYAILNNKIKNVETSHIEQLYENTKNILQKKEALYIKDLDIDGSNLMRELDIKAGKELGEILHKLLLEVYKDDTLNVKSKLLELASSK